MAMNFKSKFMFIKINLNEIEQHETRRNKILLNFIKYLALKEKNTHTKQKRNQQSDTYFNVGFPFASLRNGIHTQNS